MNRKDMKEVEPGDLVWWVEANPTGSDGTDVGVVVREEGEEYSANRFKVLWANFGPRVSSLGSPSVRRSL